MTIPDLPPDRPIPDSEDLRLLAELINNAWIPLANAAWNARMSQPEAALRLVTMAERGLPLRLVADGDRQALWYAAQAGPAIGGVTPGPGQQYPAPQYPAQQQAAQQYPAQQQAAQQYPAQQQAAQQYPAQQQAPQQYPAQHQAGAAAAPLVRSPFGAAEPSGAESLPGESLPGAVAAGRAAADTEEDRKGQTEPGSGAPDPYGADAGLTAPPEDHLAAGQPPADQWVADQPGVGEPDTYHPDTYEPAEVKPGAGEPAAEQPAADQQDAEPAAVDPAATDEPPGEAEGAGAGSAPPPLRGWVGQSVTGPSGEQLTVTILDVVDPADSTLAAAGNPPEPGQRGVLVRSCVTNSGQAPYYWAGDLNLVLETEQRALLGRSNIPVPSHPAFPVGVPPGATAEGWSVFMIPSQTVLAGLKWCIRPDFPQTILSWPIAP